MQLMFTQFSILTAAHTTKLLIAIMSVILSMLISMNAEFAYAHSLFKVLNMTTQKEGELKNKETASGLALILPATLGLGQANIIFLKVPSSPFPTTIV